MPPATWPPRGGDELGERVGFAAVGREQHQDGARGVGQDVVAGHLAEGDGLGAVPDGVGPPAAGQVDHRQPGQRVQHHDGGAVVAGTGQDALHVALGAVELAEVERADAQVREQLEVLGELFMDGERAAERCGGGRVVAGDDMGAAAHQLVVGPLAGGRVGGRRRDQRWCRRCRTRSHRPTRRSRPLRQPVSRARTWSCSAASTARLEQHPVGQLHRPGVPLDAAAEPSRVRQQERVVGLGDGLLDQVAGAVGVRGHPRSHRRREQVPCPLVGVGVELGGSLPRGRGRLVAAAPFSPLARPPPARPPPTRPARPPRRTGARPAGRRPPHGRELRPARHGRGAGRRSGPPRTSPTAPAGAAASAGRRRRRPDRRSRARPARPCRRPGSRPPSGRWRAGSSRRRRRPAAWSGRPRTGAGPGRGTRARCVRSPAAAAEAARSRPADPGSGRSAAHATPAGSRRCSPPAGPRPPGTPRAPVCSARTAVAPARPSPASRRVGQVGGVERARCVLPGRPQQGDRLHRDAAGHELQRGGGRVVEPLGVVDDHEDRLLLAGVSQQGQHAEEDQEPVAGVAGLHPEHDPQRLRLRRRNPVQRPGQRREEPLEGGERQGRLGLDAGRGHDRHVTRSPSTVGGLRQERRSCRHLPRRSGRGCRRGLPVPASAGPRWRPAPAPSRAPPWRDPNRRSRHGEPPGKAIRCVQRSGPRGVPGPSGPWSGSASRGPGRRAGGA